MTLKRKFSVAALILKGTVFAPLDRLVDGFISAPVSRRSALAAVVVLTDLISRSSSVPSCWAYLCSRGSLSSPPVRFCRCLSGWRGAPGARCDRAPQRACSATRGRPGGPSAERLTGAGWRYRRCVCARVPMLISVHDLGLAPGRRHDGDGVPARGRASGRSVFGGRPRERGGSASRELAAVHRLEVQACAHEGSSCGRESLLAEVFEGVVQRLSSLRASERQARLRPSRRGGLQEVVMVRGRSRRRPGGLIERPAQRGRALAGEVPGRAALVGGMHGDVHAAVADHLARGGEPAESPSSARIATLRERADPVVAHQRPAPWLAAGVAAQLAVNRRGAEGRARRSSPSATVICSRPAAGTSTRSPTRGSRA